MLGAASSKQPARCSDWTRPNHAIAKSCQIYVVLLGGREGWCSCLPQPTKNTSTVPRAVETAFQPQGCIFQGYYLETCWAPCWQGAILTFSLSQVDTLSLHGAWAAKQTHDLVWSMGREKLSETSRPFTWPGLTIKHTGTNACFEGVSICGLAYASGRGRTSKYHRYHTTNYITLLKSAPSRLGPREQHLAR